MRLGVIGAGRVGASFVSAFPNETVGILCSNASHTVEKAKALGVQPFFDFSTMINKTDTILVAVQDDAVQGICRKLADCFSVGRGDEAVCLFHLSGAMDLTPLASVIQKVFMEAVYTPYRAFPNPVAKTAPYLHGRRW